MPSGPAYSLYEEFFGIRKTSKTKGSGPEGEDWVANQLQRRNFGRAMSNLPGLLPMGGVLSGIRVVEQGTFITGPCAGMMLADLGADVIKVESPEGDPYRSYQGGQYSPHFQAYNRNKRSIAARSESRRGSQPFRFVGGATPTSSSRISGPVPRRVLVLGPNGYARSTPRLIYTSISGFGSSGPYEDRPSYDSVAQALSGFLSVVVDSSRPRFLGPALADAITGIYAAYGVFGALVQRGRTGQGCLVEVSMLEAMAHFAVEPFAAFFALGDDAHLERSPTACASLYLCAPPMRASSPSISPHWRNFGRA